MKSFIWRDLVLLPARAAFAPASASLFVADVHIGKAATFRALGLPAPAGTTRENLARLDSLIDDMQPRTLVVLGDLFHSRDAFRDTTLDEFAAWRMRRQALDIILVLGNHDAKAGAEGRRLGLQIVREPHAFDGLICRHYPPVDETDAPTLAGHLHPQARLSGPGRDTLRLPCFVMRPESLILPAFGEFTGGSIATADLQTSLCAIAGDRFLHIPANGYRSAAAPRFR